MLKKSKQWFSDDLDSSNYNQSRGHHLKHFQLFPALIAGPSAQLSSFQLQMTINVIGGGVNFIRFWLTKEKKRNPDEQPLGYNACKCLIKFTNTGTCTFLTLFNICIVLTCTVFLIRWEGPG